MKYQDIIKHRINRTKQISGFNQSLASNSNNLIGSNDSSISSISNTTNTSSPSSNFNNLSHDSNAISSPFFNSSLATAFAFPVALTALTTIISLALFSHPTFASSTSSANASVTVTSSCSFSSGGGTYNRSIDAGTTSEIVTNPIAATCNDISGYAIYAIGNSDDTYTSEYHTDLISGTSSDYNIKTNGTGIYGSNWKMKLTPVSSATIDNNYNTYQNIPSSLTRVAYHTTSSIGTITPSYQITVAPTQPADTFTGKVKYILVHPNNAATPITYTINYYDPSTEATNMPTNTTDVNTTGTTTISSIVPTRTNYTFLGWCTGTSNSSNITTDTTSGIDTCSSNRLSPDSIINITSDNNAYYLYAMWWNNAEHPITLSSTQGAGTTLTVNRTSSPIGNAPTGAISDGTTLYPHDHLTISVSLTDTESYADPVVTVNGDNFISGNNYTVMGSTVVISSATVLRTYMQNVTKDTCPTTATTAYDSRDETPYLIQKLNDGNCWMLENLRLDISDATIRSKMDTSNTNITEAGLTKLASTNTSWSDTYTAPKIITSSKDTLVTSYGTAAVGGKAKVGIYYNYCAASGGTICVSSTGSNATYDICPAGWRLPAGDTAAGSYYYLYNTGYDGNAANFRSALSTPLSGYFRNSTVYVQGTFGFFWSSTSGGDSNTMRSLSVDSSNVSPRYNFARYYASSVRCVRSS